MSGVDHFHSAHCPHSGLRNQSPDHIIAVTVYPGFGPSSLILLYTDARIPSYNSGMGSFIKIKKKNTLILIALYIPHCDNVFIETLHDPACYHHISLVSYYLLFLPWPSRPPPHCSGSKQVCHQLKGLFITNLSSKIHLLN